ncbi:MAG: FimV/HubP family polar landmark protein [Pseudomonas sp.]|uniref:FimV/HubP family polar landmark protein n=1 Tax=Pseudomonas sp. TaxID=306 RepID=UPI002734842A|nr:FimV/HubP family polar landmark protein [Pseudomonas sp.]MDP3846131.1 FimV/HubP family polar landmark protein [Pseudomonas sp.]
MARVHKLLLTLASSSALYSGLVPALGLGAISLHSALNEPLEADIQLLEVGDLSADDVRVRLASEADFQRSGVERIFFLNDLRFTPLFKGAQSIIRVTSNKPIREPYLNFVVEVARPNGQLLREYTVLIDPPGSSAYRAVAQLPAYAAPREAPQRPPQRAKPAPVATQGNRYRVVAGDSLWLIAQRLHSEAGQPSVPTLMADIQGLNPQAFIGGDRNRLKLDADLLLPDSIAAATVATKPSVAPSVEPNVANANSTATASSLPLNPVQQTSNADAALAQVEKRLALELAARAKENRQMQASMLALQAQLSALQEQMQGKDQQLELLRADLATNREQALPAIPAQPLTTAAANTAVLTSAPVAGDGSNTTLLAWLLGGSSLLLALLGAIIWRGRGRPLPDATVIEPAPVVVPEPAVELPTVALEPVFAAELEPELESEPLPPSKPVAARVTRPVTATADPLEGANIYIAYGRFSEALGILRKGVEAQPQRTELRLRMLEVLGELGDSAGFTQEEAVLRQQGADPVQLDQLWVRYAHVLVSEPEIVLDDVVLILDEPALEGAVPRSEVLDDFQLNLEDLSLDADWDLLSPFKPAATARSKAAALAPVANDPAFRSDLQHLPEVSEVQLEQDALSPFANWPSDSDAHDEILEEEFVDAFAGESLKRMNKPVLASLEHLATNRENLVKLNKALAYIAQGNLGSACSILNEVICDGDAQQQQEARELLAKIA